MKIKNLIMCIISTLSLMIIIYVDLAISAIEKNVEARDVSSFEHCSGLWDTLEYANVYVVNNSDNSVTFFYDGEYIEMNTISSLSDDLAGYIANIKTEDENITEIEIMEAEISGEILYYDETEIEISGFESIAFADECKLYNTDSDGDVSNIALKELAYYDFARAIIGDGYVLALITDTNADMLINVLITGTNFESNYHKEINLRSDYLITATWGDGTPFYIDAAAYDEDAGMNINISPDDFKEKFADELVDYVMISDEERIEDNNYLYITCAAGKIGIASILRNGEIPYYRGSFKIRYSENGLILINELSVEEYLYGVVPSEMPAYYPVEAIKSQVICARSFAYVQIAGSSYKIYGADVDDSTNCQVYNNLEENELINQCIDETAGMVLTKNGEVLKTYYYATSCGSLALPSDVWGGGEDLGYKEGVSTEAAIDLSSEEVFSAFICENTLIYAAGDGIINEQYQSYDMDFNWYRWSLTLAAETMTEVINNNLDSVLKAFPDKVQIYLNDELIEARPDSIGVVRNIEVTSRAQSGIILEMKISGSKYTLVISYQSAIRKLLAYSGMRITLQDGSIREGLSILPSAFFTIDYDGASFVISGGGYGHGVGLSQDGAKTMAENGLDFEEILYAYFDDVSLKRKLN